ncbi:MAG: hypothetical protein VZS44_02215 [Bacilli bacterium]|nr:hypothetical protein [Bacilli bacterium]
MKETMLYTISYDDMKKIIKDYYAQQGRNVDLRISNEIDDDRFAGMVTTSIQMTEKSIIAGIESKAQCYLNMDDLKEIIREVIDQEGKELLDLTDNAISSSRIEGYGMGEHEVKSITCKSFTITTREKKKSFLKQLNRQSDLK